MKRAKKTKIKGLTKFVRIDPRTIVEADINTPDSIVIQRFEENRKHNINSLHNPDKKGVDFFR